MKKVCLFLLLILVLPVVVFAAAIKIKDTPFLINVPDGWEVNESGWMGTLIILLDSPKDNFRANIIVYKEDVGDMSEEEYRKVNIANIKSLINDAKILREDGIVINNLKFVLIETTGMQGDIVLHWLQIYTIYKGVSYIFSGTTLEKNADRYITVFEEAFKTIQLAENGSLKK